MVRFRDRTRKLSRAEKNDERRRIMIIKPWFQYRFIVNFVGVSFLGVLISTLCVLVFYMIRSGYDLSTQLFFQATPGGPLKYTTIVSLLAPPFLVALLIDLAITLYIAVVFSHRIAGPVYRFEKAFREARKGHIEEGVKLRTADEFKEVAAELAKLLKWIKQHSRRR